MAAIRILIVDDNPAFLRSASELISSYPQFQLVGAATSASAALEQVSRERPDLVLMDMVMPDMTGLDATRMLKSGSDPPRVVVCTLYGDERYEEAAKDAGADGFLPKSRLSRQLLQVAQALFGVQE